MTPCPTCGALPCDQVDKTPMEAVAWRYRFVTTTDGKSWSDWYCVDSREEVPENPQQVIHALAVIPTQGGEGQ